MNRASGETVLESELRSSVLWSFIFAGRARVAGTFERLFKVVLTF